MLYFILNFRLISNAIPTLFPVSDTMQTFRTSLAPQSGTDLSTICDDIVETNVVDDFETCNLVEMTSQCHDDAIMQNGPAQVLTCMASSKSTGHQSLPSEQSTSETDALIELHCGEFGQTAFNQYHDLIVVKLFFDGLKKLSDVMNLLWRCSFRKI